MPRSTKMSASQETSMYTRPGRKIARLAHVMFGRVSKTPLSRIVDLGLGGLVALALCTAAPAEAQRDPSEYSWSGIWSEVPGEGRTLSSPTSVWIPAPPCSPEPCFSGQELHLFVQGTDNGIYEQILWEGSFGMGPWVPVPGYGWTPSSPTAVVYQGQIYLFVRGNNGGIWMNVRDTSGNWRHSWTEVPGNGWTPSSPAAVVDGGGIGLFVQGGDGSIWMKSSDGSGQFYNDSWRPVPGNFRTSSSPAAVFYQGQVYLFAQGGNLSLIHI